MCELQAIIICIHHNVIRGTGSLLSRLGSMAALKREWKPQSRSLPYRTSLSRQGVGAGEAGLRMGSQ